MKNWKDQKVNVLMLDLNNFRSQPMKNEVEAIQNLIISSPDWFWGLCMSMMDKGFNGLEAIGVLKNEAGKKIVLEGNRRIAVLKVLLGLVDVKKLSIPAHIMDKMALCINEEWKQKNKSVPCCIFEASERQELEDIVDRTHGYGNNAYNGRFPWDSIPKARRSRAQGNSEPELDLLEHIFRVGSRHSEQMGIKWSSQFPSYTVYVEAVRQACKIMEIGVRDLGDRYPSDLPADIVLLLDKLVADIGNKEIKFTTIRTTDHKVNPQYYVDFGFYKLENTPTPVTSGGGTSGGGTSGGGTSGGGTSGGGTSGGGSKPKNAPAHGSPRHVDQLIKQLKPKGTDASKVASLLKELLQNNTDATPNSFVCLTRCIIEISFKLYCVSNSISVLKNEREISLVEIVKLAHADVVNNVPNTTTAKDWSRDMSAPLSELVVATNPLSTTSMNIVVHRKGVSANMSSVRTSFANIFPLLKVIIG